MSKYVKNLIADELKGRLDGVTDAIIADVIGMNSAKTFEIRKLFREKGVNLLVVKRSLAGRATTDSTLNRLFEDKQGSVAIIWGCDDFVSLCKEITAVIKSNQFAKFGLKGGVMDGEELSAEQILAISKWPNRQEQISLVVGQILAPGANLSAQLLGAGAKLAGQVKKLVENKEGEA